MSIEKRRHGDVAVRPCMKLFDQNILIDTGKEITLFEKRPLLWDPDFVTELEL
jgi:hypothetical protein